MSVLSCGGTLAAMSRAAAKSAASRLRRLGLLSESVDWPRRAMLCESCPMRILEKGTSYCGRPFLDQPRRDNSIDGCGCPCRAKAKDPDEHCPLDWTLRPAQQLADGCTCKWCNAY